MFYIFLDVDGVLNKQSNWEYKFYLDNDCIENLSKIYNTAQKKYRETRIILVSTWRAGISEEYGDSKQIQVLKNKLSAFGMKIYGHTPLSKKGRQAEIEYYIRRNDIEEYVIIDDDSSLYYDIKNLNFYEPDYKTGLTKTDAKNICKRFL